MKIILFILLFFCTKLGLSQAPAANELVAIHSVDLAEMNAIATPIEGSLVYNSDDELLYQYTGSAWLKITSEGNETKIISTGHTTTSGTGTGVDPYIVSSPMITFTSNADGSFTFSNGVDDDVIFVPITPSNEPLVAGVALGAGTCSYLGINETRDIIIQGSYFDGATTVTIPGQTINTVKINSASQVTANITSGGIAGNFDITITNNIGAGTLTGGLLVEAPGIPSTNSIAITDMTLTGPMTYDGTTLTKTTSGGWNGEGYSFNHVFAAAGGKLEFTADQSNRYLMVGLSYYPDRSPSYVDLNFAMYLVANSQIQIREDGASRGYHSAYAAGDVLSIEVDCLGKVTYLRNGIVFYTSSLTVLGPLYFDTSFHTANAAISNISMTY